MKIAAIEAMWHTETPPAGFTRLRPSRRADAHDRTPRSRCPGCSGLIATRSIDQHGARHQRTRRARHAQRIRSGIVAYAALQALRADPDGRDRAARASTAHQAGSRLCAAAAALHAELPTRRRRADRARPRGRPCPNVPVLFWSFRVMVGLGLLLHRAVRHGVLSRSRGIASSATAGSCGSRSVSLPLPWIAAELGWIVAEYGRQPWAIDGVLPTFLGVSPVPAANVWLSLSGFVLFYSALAVVDVYLMVRMIRRGPDGWATGRRRRARARAAVAAKRRAAMPDYETLRLIWWAAPRRAADRLRGHGRLRSGHRQRLLPLRRPHRRWSGARC